MTAQTQSQRNASYRQRQREKIARMGNALEELIRIADTVADVHNTNVMDDAIQAARNSLNARYKS